jgi:4-alpha-glucanotransferase
MELVRSSGILLHPTSFPSQYGLGDLGQRAYEFIDFLAEAKQSVWQVLPLGPTGYGDSPYASFSSYAGNPLLISLEALVEDGRLEPLDIAEPPPFPIDKVDFGWVIHWKMPLLEKAAHNFLANAAPQAQAGFAAFCAEQADWLDDYALFMAVKETFDQKAQEAGVFGAMWSTYWDKDIALREPAAVTKWQTEKAEAIQIRKVWQYFFMRQWLAVRRYANERHIKIMGDIPIFVAPDSVDVWANRELFLLDENGRPTVVAGVPPDYFSPTGQLWGNPLYDWTALAKQNYTWWINRIAGVLRLVDLVRIDHFRGFAAYWQIPADEDTAINGEWIKAPGVDFFTALEKALGELPIIAEDLGLITQDVIDLRDQFGFPGMKILQFAFDLAEAGAEGATNAFLPHNYAQNAVVYTGTHDNNTTRGWYEHLSPAEQDLVRRYLTRPDDDVVWDLIRLAMASTAVYAIIPFQDLLNLRADARMNTPSTVGGNWHWRYRPEALNEWVSKRLSELVNLYGRDPAVWLRRREREAEAEAGTV